MHLSKLIVFLQITVPLTYQSYNNLHWLKSVDAIVISDGCSCAAKFNAIS